MASVETESRSAITAIRNAREESLVAATLDQIGWTIAYRATSNDGLIMAAQSNPSAHIIATEDFGIHLEALSNTVTFLNPRTEFTVEHLQDLLRRVDKSDAECFPLISPRTKGTTVVIAVDSGVGASTFAISTAYEESQRGKRTLLLDFNHVNPYMSQYFDCQRINRKIIDSQFGFSISEASDLTFFQEIARHAEDYDEVVIDLGRLPLGELLITGNRIHENLSRWSLQSATHVMILARGESSTLNRLPDFLLQLKQYSKVEKPHLFLLPQSTLSGRERRAITENATGIVGREVILLPRDSRAIEQAAREKAPLQVATPKSLLAREFASINRRLK